MEQYLDAKVKRFVQKRLFSHIPKTKTILGLAGTHPEKYMEVLPYHKQVILVDFNPVNSSIRRNSLIGEFDLVTSQPAHHSPITFVDCDFCKSIVSCGDDLIYIYNKMKKSLVKNKYIAFTFSLRVVGFDATLDWLKANFPELSVENRNINRYVPEMKRRQYIEELNPTLYIYRDSGDNMISGLIKL